MRLFKSNVEFGFRKKKNSFFGIQLKWLSKTETCMFIVHVWYDGHNQKVGGIEEHDKENLFSRLCGPLRDKVVMVHIVERILKLVMTYQVESQTRTTGKTAC